MQISKERMTSLINISSQIITCYQELIVCETECHKKGIKSNEASDFQTTLSKLKKLLTDEKVLYNWFMMNPAAAIELESLYRARLGEQSQTLIMEFTPDNIKNLVIRRIQEKLAEFNNKSPKSRLNEIIYYIGCEFEKTLIQEIYDLANSSDQKVNYLTDTICAKYSFAFSTPQIEEWLIELSLGINKTPSLYLKNGEYDVYYNYAREKIKEYVKQLANEHDHDSSKNKYLTYAIKTLLKPLSDERKSELEGQIANYIFTEENITKKGNANETYKTVTDAFIPDPEPPKKENTSARRNGAEAWSRSSRLGR